MIDCQNQRNIYVLYICLAIVIGGFSAYFKVILGDANNSNKTQGKLVSTAPNYKKHGQVVNIDSNLCIREEPNLDSYIMKE